MLLLDAEDGTKSVAGAAVEPRATCPRTSPAAPAAAPSRQRPPRPLAWWWRCLGVSDHGLADLLMAAPTRPRGEAADADRGHGAALNAAHRGHGIGKVSLQRV